MIEEIQFVRVDPVVIAAGAHEGVVESAGERDSLGLRRGLGVHRKNRMAHTGRNIAVYYDCEINLECGVIVKQPFTGNGVVNCSYTPAGEAATVAYFGPYNQLSEAHTAILARCQAENRALAGPSWEIYGHWSDDPATLRTDVFYLLAPGPG